MKRIAGRTIVRIVMCVSAAAATAQCGGGSGDTYDDHAPYGTFTTTTAWQYNAAGLDGTTKTHTLIFNGEETLGGVTYARLTLSTTDATGDVLVTPPPLWDAGPLTLGTVRSSTGTTITPTTPWTVDPAPPVGEPVAVSQAFTGHSALSGLDFSATLTGTYTLVDDDATAATPAGDVHGCRHYTGAVEITGTGLPSFLPGVALSPELWYHPTLGVVMYEIPELGLAGDLESTWDVGDPTGEYNTIRRSAVIDAANPTFDLDTYEADGALDADKNTHARMVLELRWADEDRARTGPMPGYPTVNVEFGTVWGVFPAALVESPVSVLHPEENGSGYKYWIAFVSEAARNEPGDNGIAYHVRVTADTDVTPPLRASARIYYHRYLP